MKGTEIGLSHLVGAQSNNVRMTPKQLSKIRFQIAESSRNNCDGSRTISPPQSTRALSLSLEHFPGISGLILH